jgi:hypothetical protein
MSGESPWKDSTSIEPACYKHIRFSIEHDLTRTLAELGDISIGEFDSILDNISHIPDPNLPYQDKRELKNKRFASVLESLLDYKDDRTFIQLDW